MTYTDKKQLIKLLSYMATFDGGIYKPFQRKEDSKVNYQFILNMRKENEDYVRWVGEVISTFTSVRITEKPDYNTDGHKRQPQLRLESTRHPIFTDLHSRIYIDKTKVIDPHMLKLMDAEALAIIFMADGGSYLDERFKNPHASIDLHTKGFSYHDNLALSKAIYEKTNIRTTVNRHNKYYYLRVKSKDVGLFVQTVLPFVCNSFLYKLERLTPAMGEEIVCSIRQRVEAGRNDQSLVTNS